MARGHALRKNGRRYLLHRTHNVFDLLRAALGVVLIGRAPGDARSQHTNQQTTATCIKKRKLPGVVMPA